MNPTCQDLINQSNMANTLRTRGWLVQEIGNPYYPADFLIYKDGYQALAEYKRRNFYLRKYPTYQMFAKKFAEVRLLAREMSIQPLLIVEWDDTIGFLNLDSVSPEIVLGGRRDRGRDETEPCVNISLDFFSLYPINAS